MVCCGQKMTHLEAGVVEASREKHIPVAVVENGTVNVSVGSVEHPMSKEHSIEWIYLETSMCGHRVCLSPDSAPSASFRLAEGEHPVRVYAYCNLHGLWMSEF